MRVEAVVIAAGEGRRMRPLSERWPKAVLPIDGRPVIATLLREVAAAGIERATVVVGEQGGQIESLLGDGAAFGVELVYALQPRALGSADALRVALAAGARTPLIVAAADTLFTTGDIGRLAELMRSRAPAGAMTVRRFPPPGEDRPAARVEGDRIARVIDDDPSSPLSAGPLWALGSELLPYLDGLPGPPFALATLFQRALDDGLVIAALSIGPTRDLSDPFDLVRENFDYLRGLSRP
jgi:NDP-sugar pyrophosphorylase family protein